MLSNQLVDLKLLLLIFFLVIYNKVSSFSSFEGQLLDCINSNEQPNISNCTKINTTNSNISNPSRRLTKKPIYDEQNSIDGLCSTHNLTSFVCTPKEEVSEKKSPSLQHQDKSKPLINVYIRTSTNETNLDYGSNVSIECRFNTTVVHDFKFKLRWLRHVAGLPGFNQSISQTETDNPMVIIAATTRIWTVQRLNGLNLELNDFQPVDSGHYFCQAVSLNDTNDIISEDEIYLTVKQNFDKQASIIGENNQQSKQIDSDEILLYSQDNLSKLLPSLKVIPDFAEIGLGESIQLICITTEFDDPDPEENHIEWFFESSNRSQLHYKKPIFHNQLPSNITVHGNVLIIWSMSSEHIGFYKCTHKLVNFDLSVQAVGEITLKYDSDSAPLVYVSPEVVRLSPNGSATIQCEATGYPAPNIIWYRVDSLVQPMTYPMNTEDPTVSEASSTKVMNLENYLLSKDNVQIETIPHRDCLAYCIQHKCGIIDSISKHGEQSKVTAISLIHIDSAQAKHQGQYVCQASNKHGSNQASAMVDIEFKEPPVISIDPIKQQTFFLSDNSDEKQLNVTFKCVIRSGKPKPKLTWLRTQNTKSINLRNAQDNSDVYDLTKISSASSNVSTWSEDNGNSLCLSFNSISVEDEGDYVCLAENEWGRNTVLAHLAVRKPASIKIPQSSPFVARVNDSFHLDCIASGHPIPIDLEWNRSDKGAFFSLISRTNSVLGNQERAVLKFDRVTIEDSGEYTCNARDPINSSIVLRDTIMVLVEEPDDKKYSLNITNRQLNSLFPRLMVRPTKVETTFGSNVTIDCLSVSGLQPTIVEWVGPPNELESNHSITNTIQVKPYYREGYENSNLDGQLFQFGSKLKIINITKAHEGVYQCRGRNKVGLENAPALVKIVDYDRQLTSELATNYSNPNNVQATKTKVAKIGSNIELKCQVSGFEQPITSWSREGMELPESAVQIEHNLWIQNVSNKDNGLFICSAKSKQPNKVIQAKIRLLVTGEVDTRVSRANLTAKIIASKSIVNVGDSITLECIINQSHQSLIEPKIGSLYEQNHTSHSNIVDEIERNVIWTNLRSGQSLFQDNVYVQNNLLIIYELKPEDSAIYRCNYNDFTQYTDYKLQVLDSNGQNVSIQDGLIQTIDTNGLPKNQTNFLISSSGQKVDLRQTPIGSRLVIDCSLKNFQWFKLDDLTNRNRGVSFKTKENTSLVFESISVEDAAVYQCRSGRDEITFLIQVLIPVARFVQKTVSFITLPTISGANHQLDLEVKFLPERDTGLILFNGQQQNGTKTKGGYIINGDYISLGLNHGYLEFRFELGDGTTQLKSHQPLSLNQWHKVVIERNQKGAVMYVDGQIPVSNSSTGKFLNLNLDSVLYIGGHQFFMNNMNKTRTKLFYGYPRGFQGCISSLKIFKNEIDLMARNRSVSMGIYECDKPECSYKAIDCNRTNSVCQVDRKYKSSNTIDSNIRASSNDDLRCICLPNFTGNRCDEELIKTNSSKHDSNMEQTAIIPQASTTESPLKQIVPNQTKQGSCESLNPCSSNGTSSCQSLTSTSFKCHCALGFIGSTCAETAQFTNETRVGFNAHGYLQISFNKLEEVLSYQSDSKTQIGTKNDSLANNSALQENFDSLQYVKLTSMADQLNVSFHLQTKSSYGIIFYTGGHQPIPTKTPSTGYDVDGARSPIQTQLQMSKSMVANLLARLRSITGELYVDYLAVALVDGHLELNFELGSGVAIIRSTQRVNDGNIHSIKIIRMGKKAKIVIDDQHTQEGTSPGKLSVLNSGSDIYLGGLPHLMMPLDSTTNNGHTISTTTTTNYLSSFVGCLSNLEINSLGPINLIRSSTITQIKGARNLSPCLNLTLAQNSGITSASHETLAGLNNATNTNGKPKPYQAPPVVEDDPGEM